MKTVLKIFGIIAVLIALGAGAASIYRAGIDKEKLAEQEKQATNEIEKYKEDTKNYTGETKALMDEEIAKAEEKLKEAPSSSSYTILQFLHVLLLLVTLAFAVFLFRPNSKLTTQLLIATVVVILAAYFISPDIKRGMYGGAETKTLVLISGFPIIITGLFAFLIAKKSAVKAN